jgi:hypothetical protein
VVELCSYNCRSHRVIDMTNKAMITCGKCLKDAMVEVGYAFLPENYKCPHCGNTDWRFGL